MIDWVAFFTQYPYLINSAYVFIIWMQWGIAFGFLFSYPMMYPFNYMFLRSDNIQFDDGRYFRDVYPTYRSYAFRSISYWRWKYISMPRFYVKYMIWHLDDFSSKIIRYYLT